MSGQKTIDIRALQCPQCGAPARVHPEHPDYVCQFCNCSFLVERPPEPPPPPPQPPRFLMPLEARPRIAFPDIDSPPKKSGAVVGLVVTLSIIGVVAGIVALSLSKSGLSVFGNGWSGKEPLVCSGNQWIVVDHIDANFAKGIAIDASGNCVVSCKDCKISAPTVIRARENASVHLDHGSADGTTFDDVRDNASVSIDHTKTTGDKKEPAFGSDPEPKEWPSSGPYVCGGNSHNEFKNVKVKVSSGAAIVASVNCSLKLSNCTIDGPVALLLNDNADIELDDCEVHATDGVVARANGSLQLEGGSFVAKDHAALLEDNANVHANGAHIEGSTSKNGNATFESE